MKKLPKLYLTRAGRNGEDEDLALENNLAILSFREIPSLDGLKDSDAVAKLVSDALPDEKPRKRGNIAGQLWAFAIAMQEGDLVVLPRKLTSQIAIGRVTGPYRFRHTACGVAANRSPTDDVRAGPSVLVRCFHDGVQHLAQ